MNFHRRTFAEIDLDALARNVKRIKDSGAASQFLCPMVKANGYGHGDVGVASALEKAGVEHLGVCLVEEGMALREGGVNADVLVFLAADKQALQQSLDSKLTPVVSKWTQIEDLEFLASERIDIHVKFDTGMHRLGFPVAEARKVFERLEKNPKLRVRGVATHLFHGEDADQAEGDSARQLAAFAEIEQIFRPLNPVFHALNSAGLVHRMAGRAAGSRHSPAVNSNYGARPGLMIYGFNPIGDGYGCELEPVMTLRSEAEVYRTIAPGEGVSYNATWKAKRESVIAVVPIGYADGYHRVLSNKAHVLFEGERVPVVGTVCMDYLMIDVTDVARRGQLPEKGEVVLFGRSKTGATLGADELARVAGTITWEVLTSVGPRLPRIFKGWERQWFS